MESNPAPLPQSASLWDSQSWRGKEACPAEVTTATQGAGRVWTQVGFSVCQYPLLWVSSHQATMPGFAL